MFVVTVFVRVGNFYNLNSALAPAITIKSDEIANCPRCVCRYRGSKRTNHDWYDREVAPYTASILYLLCSVALFCVFFYSGVSFDLYAIITLCGSNIIPCSVMIFIEVENIPN